MAKTNLKDTVVAGYEMLAKGDVGGMASFAADDFAYEFPRRPAMDLQTYQRLVEQFRKQLPDLTLGLRRAVGEGNTVVVEFSAEATTTEGKKYRNQGVVIVDFNEEGKVRRLTEYLDTLSVVEAGLEGFFLEA